ncbi:ABC transporter substrate-binding protein [Shimazuella alba]|uniref:ABC transporter substrate-binding protein n=1 Tax=Shimazuella alba TaxID=2690964 RepID=A0A6I4VSU2_9BACL|nr:ABC transporter substrate-binding protein [Shimazuella alba]MXQ53528.1 ABC transporter substrate-binding protein [Shimazuella alba]
MLGKKKWMSSLAVLLTGALFVTGCASNANSNQGNQDTRKTMTIAYSDGGQTLDPAEASDLTSDTMTMNAYDQLVTYGVKTVDGNQKADTEDIKPMLASEWKVSADGKTYTFILRDAKFHSGNPVDAESVVYSMNHVKNSQNGSFMYQMASIKKVTAKDDKTVVIELNRPNHMFLQMIGMYTFSIIDGKTVKTKPKDYLKTNTAGSGPYKVDSWDPASQAVLSANTSYWQGAPKISKVTMKFIKEPSNRVMLLNKGDVDLAIEIPPKDVDSIKKNAKLNVTSTPSNRILYFAFNEKVKPFDNAKVRQAINYAIPYDQLVHDVMYDQAKQLKSSIPSSMPGYTEDGFVYKHDLNKAKQLLKEAGLPNGFTFDFTLGSGFDDWKDDAVLIQAELRKIGVTMNIKPMARPEFLTAVNQKTLTTYISKWTSFVNDPGYHLGLLLYSKGSSNAFSYNNAQVDKLWEQAEIEKDKQKREALYKQMQVLINADAPWVYLYEYNRVVGSKKEVKGYITYPDECIRFFPLSK